MGMIAIALSGCAISQEGFLQDYATVGGKWQRSDPTSGRVGSVFSDPGFTGTTISLEDGSVVENDSYYGTEIISDGTVYSEGVPYYEGNEYYSEEFVPGPTQVDQDGVIILGDDW